jgi:hypothetical protein
MKYSCKTIADRIIKISMLMLKSIYLTSLFFLFSLIIWDILSYLDIYLFHHGAYKELDGETKAWGLFFSFLFLLFFISDMFIFYILYKNIKKTLITTLLYFVFGIIQYRLILPMFVDAFSLRKYGAFYFYIELIAIFLAIISIIVSLVIIEKYK